MTAWWNELTNAQQVFMIIAMAGSVIVVLQFILSLIGIGGAASADTGDVSDISGLDHDGHFHDGADMSDMSDMDSVGDGAVALGAFFSLFTLRGIIAGLAIGGWAGVLMSDSGSTLHIAWVIVIAVAIGLAVMFLVSFLYRLMGKLHYNGTIIISNSVGQTGTVYIRIPALNKGSGKINVIIQGKYTEIDARTNSPVIIPTGAEVKIVSMYDENTVIVEPS